MNKEQRTMIQKISQSLNQLNTQLELLMEEEQSKIDNLPDSLIGSSKEDK